jgi:hypothetical protein
MQMVVMPLYPALAQPVPVIDTVANGFLATQVGTLLAMNQQLLTLNNAQSETNKKLDQILAAIKYTPPSNTDSGTGFPTTDNVLIEFASTLYAAYTSESYAYNVLREASAAKRNGTFSGGPRRGGGQPEKILGGPRRGGTTGKEPTFTYDPNDPDGYNPSTEPTFTYDPADPDGYGSITIGSGEGQWNPDGYYDADQGRPDRKPADPLGDFANFTDQVVKWTGNLVTTYDNLNKLSNCRNPVNCLSKGFNTVTGILKTFNIKISPEFQKTLGYIGAGLSVISLVVDLFSGGFDVGKLLEFINGMQQNILFASLAKGGLVMDNDDESKTLRILSNSTTIFGFAGLYALRDTNASAWISALNNYSKLGELKGENKSDTKNKTGTLYRDSPRAGANYTNRNNTSTTQENADFLLSIIDCNRKKVRNATQCEQDKARIKRKLQGTLKGRCAAMAMSQQQVPAKMFQELFTGTGNQKRCEKVSFYDTKSGKELCPSIALLQASSLAERSVMSQMNVLIGLSMYNLVMTNINTEQVILQNVCASMGDMIQNVTPSDVASADTSE